MCFQNLRTVGNVFIVNLAIADLCVTAFVDPFNIVSKFIFVSTHLALAMN